MAKEKPQNDTFEGSSKSEWLEIIEKGLKGKELSDHSTSKYGLHMDPFVTQKDITFSGAIRSENNWKMGVSIAVKEPTTLNKEILHFLHNGAEAIRIYVQNWEDLPIIYNQVHADWIHNDLIVDSIEKISFDSFPVNTAISCNLHNQNETILRLETNALDPFVAIQTLLTKADSAIENSVPKKIQFHLPIGDYLPIEVSKLRALRILWANYLKAKNISDIPLLISSTVADTQNEHDLALIEQTTSAINAVLGCTDILYINSADRNYQRLALHIQNIMKMESAMEHSIDPVAGSYAFEKITNDMALQAWQNFLTRS